jgi:hypothetical protein
VDPNLDLDWYSAKMLYPGPDSINPDPNTLLGTEIDNRRKRDRGEETDVREGR